MGDLGVLIFDKMYFSLPADFAERSEIKRLIIKFGGKIKLPDKIMRKDVTHLAPPGWPREELLVNPADVLSTEWVHKCVELGEVVQREPFLLYPDAVVDQEQAQQEEAQQEQDEYVGELDASQPPPPPPPGQDPMSKKGAKKGEKLLPWTGEEFRVLIDYARRNRDSFGVSGNKLWERAERENILPGRSMQAMRECAKRKRAFIEMDDPLPARKTARDAVAGTTSGTLLELAVTRLAEACGQDNAAVCWALYQCNGEFKRARKILFGEITENDFHPWSNDEDEIIVKYARGLLEAEATPQNKHAYVLSAHGVTSEAESASIDGLLCSRDYHEIANRARYLCDERELL